MELPAHAAKVFLRKARAERKSACILSGDMKGAFYSVLPETFLGPTLAPKHREALFDVLGLSAEAKQRLLDLAQDAPGRLAALGLDEQWATAVREWHRECWYGVAGSPDMVATFRGARPGDPIADMIFCCVFALLMRKLALRLAGCGVKVALPGDASALVGSARPLTRSDLALCSLT